MRKINEFDFHFLFLLIFFFALVFFCVRIAWSKEARSIKLDNKKVAVIFVHPGKSTMLSFPIKPTKVILGSKGLFTVDYVENDIAVSAIGSTGVSNLFVYVEGQRYAFDLKATTQEGDSIVIIGDDSEKSFPFKVE